MENNISKFKPDFVFWAQKGEQYLILFVDPKSLSFLNISTKWTVSGEYLKAKFFHMSDLESQRIYSFTLKA
jgi:hypothetical protein